MYESCIEIFEEDLQKWAVEIVKGDTEEKVNVEENKDLIENEFDVWKKATYKLLNRFKQVNFNSIKSIFVEKNDLPIIELQTEK